MYPAMALLITLLFALSACTSDEVSEQEAHVEECIYLLTAYALIYRAGANADESEVERMEQSLEALGPRARVLADAIERRRDAAYEAGVEAYQPIYAPELVASINRFRGLKKLEGEAERRLYAPTRDDLKRLRRSCMMVGAHPYGS